MASFIKNSNVNAIIVPILGIVVNNGGLRDRSIYLVLAVEEMSRSVELHVLKSTLGCLEVGSSQSFNLCVLKSTVIIIEALAASSSWSSQISKILHLPISPTSKMLVTWVTNLIDFINADWAIQAGTKFTDKQRNTKSLGILISYKESLVMPVFAFILIWWVRLSSCANWGIKLAAISVVVKNVDWWSDLSTWRVGEAKIPNNST